MNIELSDCSKCHKPKNMQKSKGKNLRNKEQSIDLEPSKAWIKNIGAGTTKEMLKIKTKRDTTLVMATTLSKPHKPSPAPANTTKNDNVTASQTNGIQFDFGMENPLDKTMVSIQQINDTNAAGPAKSSEQANVTSDNDSISNFQTCIEFDTTRMNADAAETNDSEPIEVPTTTMTKTIQSKTIGDFKHFPLELNTILEDETSLYGSMSIIDRMKARMNDAQRLSEDLSTVKHEWNEHLDDTIINETLPHEYSITMINREFEDVKPSTAHELSIPLGPFDFPSSSSLPMNSTVLSTDTIAQFGKNLRHMESIKPEVDANILDAHTPFKVLSYAQFESDKKSQKKKSAQPSSDMSWSLLTQASNQVPKTPSLSRSAFVHPVYMCEEDVNRLIQSGHIFFTEGRLHYKHKTNAQKKVF